MAGSHARVDPLNAEVAGDLSLHEFDCHNGRRSPCAFKVAVEKEFAESAGSARAFGEFGWFLHNYPLTGAPVNPRISCNCR